MPNAPIIATTPRNCSQVNQHVQDLVIGGGVVGVACAHALAEAGREVVLVDKGSICGGCSHGNAGWVTPCHSLPLPGPGLVKQTLKWMLRSDSPLYIKPTLRPTRLAWLWRFYRHCNAAAREKGLQALASLNQHAVPMTRDLVQRLGLDCQFEQRGILYGFHSEQSLAKGIKEYELQAGHGIEGEVLSRDDVMQREPNLRDDVCGGVFYPGESDCVPDRFVKQLADRLPALGVRVLPDTPVEHLELTGRKVSAVTTARDTFVPETVVLATGAWTTHVARRLGVRLSMEPGKGYSVTLRQQPGTPQSPINLSEAKCAVTPWRDTVRIAGTMEVAGLQLSINRRRVEAIIAAAKNFLPDFHGHDILETWTGMRPVTSDGLPIIGRPARVTNLTLATGHAMLGLTQAIITARLVTDLTTGNDPLIPLEPFSPDRF